MDDLWSPWRMKYITNNDPPGKCIFCTALAEANEPDSLIVYQGALAFVILNRYPYTSGHLMVVPYMHQPTIEALHPETRAEMMELANHALGVLRTVYHPEGFNIGINLGSAAGAGIAEHVHLHVVPRWAGDTNFMSTVGSTRVIPEDLLSARDKIKNAWKN